MPFAGQLQTLKVLKGREDLVDKLSPTNYKVLTEKLVPQWLHILLLFSEMDKMNFGLAILLAQVVF